MIKPLSDKSLHFNVGRLAFFFGLRKISPYQKEEEQETAEWEAGWCFGKEEFSKGNK